MFETLRKLLAKENVDGETVADDPTSTEADRRALIKKLVQTIESNAIRGRDYYTSLSNLSLDTLNLLWDTFKTNPTGLVIILQEAGDDSSSDGFIRERIMYPLTSPHG